MTESRVFNLPEGINAAVVGKEVENFLRGNKNLFTEGVETRMVSLFKQKNMMEQLGKRFQV